MSTAENLPSPCRCSMLPKYYRHVQANPGTLLTRFYGVHRVKPSHGRKVGAGEPECMREALLAGEVAVWGEPLPPGCTHAIRAQPAAVMNTLLHTELGSLLWPADLQCNASLRSPCLP